jgi:hypothetical protein
MPEAVFTPTLHKQQGQSYRMVPGPHQVWVLGSILFALK